MHHYGSDPNPSVDYDHNPDDTYWDDTSITQAIMHQSWIYV